VLTPVELGYLMVFGFCAGLFDSTAGGGGLITLPALLGMGIPPHLAIGTNKLQSSFGSGTAAFNYTRHGLVKPSELIPGIVLTASFALLGALTLSFMQAQFLTKVIPYLLLIVFLQFLFVKNFGSEMRTPKLPKAKFYRLFSPILGFYDGFFGPGVGTFWAFVHVQAGGHSLRSATAHTKIFNFTSNIVSLLTFLVLGKVYILAGICMGLGQILGAYVGSNLISKSEVKWLKNLFMVVIAATIVRMFFFS
jgi:uncharacterized protein